MPGGLRSRATLGAVLAAVFSVRAPFAQVRAGPPGGLPSPSMIPPPSPLPVALPSPATTPPPLPSPSPSPAPMPELSVPAQPAAPLEEELRRSHYEISLLYQAARYHQAMPLAERYVALARSLVGDDHPTNAAAITSLSLLYRGQGRYAEAEPLFMRALAIRREGARAGAPQRRRRLGQQPRRLYHEQGRYAKAEPLFLSSPFRSREGARTGAPPGSAMRSTTWPGCTRRRAAIREAEPLVKRALTIVETAQGPSMPMSAGCSTRWQGSTRAWAGRR